MKSIAVVGVQWGDEGKGKVVDYMAASFDAVARYAGGATAVHTAIYNGQKFVLHLIPCAMVGLAGQFLGYGERLVPVVADSAELINKMLNQGLSVLFEGAQGSLLDIDHGTYPFVTSSNATVGGACTGLGVAPTRINGVVGVT